MDCEVGHKIYIFCNSKFVYSISRNFFTILGPANELVTCIRSCCKRSSCTFFIVTCTSNSTIGCSSGNCESLFGSHFPNGNTNFRTELIDISSFIIFYLNIKPIGTSVCTCFIGDKKSFICDGFIICYVIECPFATPTCFTNIICPKLFSS